MRMPSIRGYIAERWSADDWAGEDARLRFIQSQFWYYRGERAPGGLLAEKSDDGWPRRRTRCAPSVRLCPKNPLAVYMLGRVYYAMER